MDDLELLIVCINLPSAGITMCMATLGFGLNGSLESSSQGSKAQCLLPLAQLTAVTLLQLSPLIHAFVFMLCSSKNMGLRHGGQVFLLITCSFIQKVILDTFVPGTGTPGSSRPEQSTTEAFIADRSDASMTRGTTQGSKGL